MALRRVETIPALPKRSSDGHKGLYGSILVVAGSRGMAGAAGLAGASALRSAPGLVRVATPAEVQPTVASFETCYMTYPLPCDGDGAIDFKASKGTLERLGRRRRRASHRPGLGQTDDVRALVRWALESAGKPLVLDADGLNALVGEVGLLDLITHPTVLTPHPGEFARLVGASVEQVQDDRDNQAAGLPRGMNISLSSSRETLRW